jgi:hypothetical protein
MQLLELLPKQAADAARLSLDVLGHVVEGLRGDASVSAGLPEGSLLLRGGTLRQRSRRWGTSDPRSNLVRCANHPRCRSGLINE